MRLLNGLLLLPTVLRTAIAYSTLSDDSLRTIPSAGADFDIKTGAILAPILQPRVPGTPGSTAVLEHLADFFRNNLPKWKVSFQNSTSTTPLSNGREVPFHNLIATRDPPWIDREGEVGRLALVAHYDSLIHPTGFIGAIDSAAPCAMLLHAARSIDDALTRKWEAMQAEAESSDFSGLEMDEHKGVQILLLDGEEAFQSWTDTDSLYGARAMAEEWEQTVYAASSTYSTPLASIDLFVLLDLLGSPNPTVPSYFKTTHWAYQHMADLEFSLRRLGLFKSAPAKDPDRPSAVDDQFFLHEAGKADTDQWLGGYIGDDHLPFMARGVEVLHLIPAPFPRVWHKIDDDGEHLDMNTVEDWALLTTAFAAEWLELEGFMTADGGGKVRERDEL
ncbi:peptidase M28 [Neohortaea acidophila]|uniref:Peptide hydrolase n=1 Tax=Neohortaea acidophila TaxID=245834 RepID=A0A6A6PV70_9PEZI|nr:peptidase M28 [Neohortaea acidophila]KAF2483882.1 peptidase M28 [Neohortaea acidophila]